MPHPAKAAFYLALLVTFVMAIVPHPPQLPGDPGDKVQHIVAFATLSVLASVAYPKRPWVVLLAGLGMFGALIELVQAIPALNRDSDIVDLLADLVASFLTLIGVIGLRRLTRSEPRDL